ncbi:hypothetical protein BD560DRAFT_441262 [Blakeslea trispora]|nr:hypothetical protein BD560DRAFT_441262 [Blakeslea trispora]
MPPAPNSSIALELEGQGTVQLENAFKHLAKKDSGYGFQLIYHNVQSLKAHLNQITNDTAYLVSDFILLGETWTTSTQHFELSGFEEVSRVDNQGITPRANGSLCFVKKHLIEDKRVSSKHATMTQDQNNQKMSISSFMFNETLIACICCSPSFNNEKAMDENQKICYKSMLLLGSSQETSTQTLI